MAHCVSRNGCVTVSHSRVEKREYRMKEGKIKGRRKNWLPGQTWWASDCTPSQSASSCCWSATQRRGVEGGWEGDTQTGGGRDTKRRDKVVKFNLPWGRKCTDKTAFRFIFSHRHTPTLVLTSVSWQCFPRVPACRPLAQCQSRGLWVPAGNDGHRAHWAPSAFDLLPTIHHLTSREGIMGWIKMLLPISFIWKKRMIIERSSEMQQGGDRIRCWTFTERCSSLCFRSTLSGKLASWKHRLMQNLSTFSAERPCFQKRLDSGGR